MNGRLPDVRNAFRRLRRSPAHSAAVIASLALGIAAVTAVFTVLDAVVLQPLPYPQTDRLVMLYETNPERGWERAEVAPANVMDWRTQMNAFTDITVFQDWLLEMALTGEGEARTLRALPVFGNFFDVLGVNALVGRTFRFEETWTGSDDVAVLSNQTWRRDFGGDPDVIGRRIVLEGRTRTVIGVMPPDFREPPVLWSSPSALSPAAEIFIPYGVDPAAVASELFYRQAHIAQAIGRLRPGATIESARAELTAAAARLEARYPETNRAMGAGALPLREWVVEDGRTPLLLLLAAAALVLVLTCANVANLMLARGAERQREMAVRGALGARGSRLAGEVLTESAVLGLAGGIAGLIVAAWTIDALLSVAPSNLPRLEDATVNLRAFAFAAVVALLASLGFGLAPALGAARPQPDLIVRGSRSTETRSRRRASAALIALQVALAITVLSGAGLLFRTFVALRGVDPGFDPRNVLAFELALPANEYPDRSSMNTFLEATQERLRELPGVEAVAMVSRLPLTGGWTSDGSIEGETRSVIRNIRHREVGPDYFSTIGTPLIAGREITAADRSGPPVAIINRAFADRHFGGTDPIGQRIAFDAEPGPDAVWRTIVGVVENTRGDGLRAAPDPEVFGTVSQESGRNVRFVLRTSTEPLSLSDAVRAAVSTLDADMPVRGMQTLEQVFEEALARERFLFVLMGTFAALAVLLASIGVYGTTSNAVRRRASEIGIRMALGAAGRDVATWVIRFAMRPVAAGAVLGLLGAVLAGRVLRSVLFGVSAVDPLTLAAVALTLLAFPLLASLLPARSAARTDPLAVLRKE